MQSSHMAVLDRCLVLAVAAVVGCGGAEFTASPTEMSTGVDGTDIDSDATDSGAPDVEDDDARAQDAHALDGATTEDARADVSEACSPTTFFEDGDADGYGGTTSVVACVAPSTGRWVTRGGDCDDSNAAVNPGQSAFFATGYTPSGTTRISFDYDCDGQEHESGAPPKAACAFVSLSCTGSGYIEATPVRSGPGVDSFCGSAEAITCALIDLVCQAGAPAAASSIACH